MGRAALVIADALAAQREGYHAFVIGPSKNRACSRRAAADIPVTGLGEATTLHACALRRKSAW